VEEVYEVGDAMIQEGGFEEPMIYEDQNE